MSFNDLYMRENPFYYPGMTPEEYEEVTRGLAGRSDDIIEDVRYGRLVLKPQEERTKEYIYGLLGIESKYN